MDWERVTKQLREKAENLRTEAITESRNYTKQTADIARADALHDVADAIQTELFHGANR